MSDKVTVVASDWGGGWDFDGFPFSGSPEWLLAALKSEDLTPTDGGDTDYAVWTVVTPLGVAVAEPGDTILRDNDGHLWVRKTSPVHPETGED